MSHDFAIWESQDPLEDEDAGQIYAELIKAGRSGRAHASDKISIVAQELNARWPEPPIGQEDNSPWSSPIDVDPSHLIVTIVPSRLWDVWPVLGELAKQHELVMYDPQQQTVFLPPRLSQKRTRLRAKQKRQASNQNRNKKTNRRSK
jgi:hypothetical protein